MSNLKYVEEFYKLNCYPDILDIVLPVQRLKKEITESMAIIKQLRKLTLKNKLQRFQIYDFCAGNALTSVLACFLFKNIYHAYAIDKLPRERDWGKVNNFDYIVSDIYENDWASSIAKFRTNFPFTKTVIISVHPCRTLAKKVISIHNESENDYLILNPCCTGKTHGYGLPDAVVEKIGKYLKWCLYLQNQVKGNSRLHIDNHCLSPKNAIITSGL